VLQNEEEKKKGKGKKKILQWKFAERSVLVFLPLQNFVPLSLEDWKCMTRCIDIWYSWAGHESRQVFVTPHKRGVPRIWTEQAHKSRSAAGPLDQPKKWSFSENLSPKSKTEKTALRLHLAKSKIKVIQQAVLL
jgi:hypothetical protein